MTIKWSGMDKIDHYCENIVKVIKLKEMSMLDLARCVARFKTFALLLQATIDRIQEERSAELRSKGKKKIQ